MTIERDDYSTGGNLSFYYDENARTAFLGEENEVVQFYEQDVTKGFVKEGCRVGVKLTPAKEIKDIGSLTFRVGKEEIQGEKVAVKIDDKLAYFQIFPIIEKAGQKIDIKIEYKGKKQTYFIKINENVILMEKNERNSPKNLT